MLAATHGSASETALCGTKSNPTTVSDSPVTDPGSVVKASNTRN